MRYSITLDKNKKSLAKAREQFLKAQLQAHSPKVERMMALACPKRKRYAA